MPTHPLRIVDETAGGDALHEVVIPIEKTRLTVKDIIAARVEDEVRNYNGRLGDHFNGLVQPKSAEVALNGFKMKQRKEIDAEQQVYVALDAFQKNGYFVFVNDLQAESLEQEVEITADLKVSFVKLTPLVGG